MWCHAELTYISMPLMQIVNAVYTTQPAGSCLPSLPHINTRHILSWAQNKGTETLIQSTLSSWNVYEQWNKHPGCISQYMPRYKAYRAIKATVWGASPNAGQDMCLASEAVCWCRCTVFVVHREQMALPLTPPCVFLSPSWTAAWGGPYLVKLGGGEGKALKARLCGDAIRQTAVRPQTPTPQPLSSNSPYCPSSAFWDHTEMLLEHCEGPWALFEQQKLLDRPWELCRRYHVVSFPSQITSNIEW